MKVHFAYYDFDAFDMNISRKGLRTIYERYKNKNYFEILSKKSDIERFYLANFIERDVRYPAELLEDGADVAYTNWLKRNESLTYLIMNEISSIEEDFIQKFKCCDGQHPQIFKLYRRKQLSIETLIALNSVLKFIPLWDEKIRETILWPVTRIKCIKYEPFLQYDKAKVRSHILEIVKHEAEMLTK